MQLTDVLDDLCMRFLFNLPAAEWESFERLFFAIEAAHWFYDDFYREKYLSLPRLQLKPFAAKIFAHTNLLHSYSSEVDKLTSQFQSYKQLVMTCGAALLNSSLDKVVLVRGWGSTARWGFPKGKLANNESELAAAVREVQEETGFDMEPYITADQFYLDSFISRRHCRIFLVPGVPEDTVFETQTRKEISDIKWVPIADLPDSLKTIRQQVKQANGKTKSDGALRFAQNGVVPFTKRLRSWVKRQNKRKRRAEPHIELNMQSAITAEELEATLLPTNSPPNEPPHHENGRVASPEASQVRVKSKRQGTPTSKRKSSKSKGRGGSTSVPGSGRKSKRNESNETARNQLTFGATGGTSMNDSERASLFRQYVVESDRIAAEKGVADDFWPVPYITSKDFTPEEIRVAQDAAKANLAKRAGTESMGDEAKREASTTNTIVPDKTERRAEKIWALPRPKEKAFEFDRAAVLSCMVLDAT